jgi:3',5'-cyclic-AMP phosphodiesterase
MPLIIDRRSFLRSSLQGAASVAISSRFALSRSGQEARWALLSDTHIAADKADEYRGFRPHTNLRQALAQLQTVSFDMVLINGDLARSEGTAGDYEMLSEYLASVTENHSLAITLGNHDDRKNARAALAFINGDIQHVEKKLIAAIDTEFATFLLLDSLMVTNIAAGQLGASQRKWLADYLQQNRSKPIVIFVHHNLDPDDDAALVDSGQFLQIVRPARNVKAIFYGHTHAWAHTSREGLHLVNIPATGYNFKDSEPVGWTDAAFTKSGVSLKLNAFAGNTTKNGETAKLLWR